ncbi:MAG: carbohydrate ABC transporter permease [Chloroflexi bacterium]|nr:carbohydrate ABC transporter permease [Ardenticatenaceae bacterium]MBL1128578.1 carbohydrate ABC transporter permease [Chloroflexota bacterium]NOG34657.1 carbohydrate ABC transporter permease [Chloroflexota bacterium]GIK57717.1 MAG: ABC transporter permease [Chloroflexota bacterium]
MTASYRRVPTRALIYILLLFFSMFYLIPMYVMLVTGFKNFDEVSLRTMWDLPSGLAMENFRAAYQVLAPHLWNSIRLVIPTAMISAMIGSINGYILTKWRFPGVGILFPLILFGMFIPYQSIIIPLVQFMSWLGLAGGIPGLALAHIIYGIPITTLIFRGYYASVPSEMVEAARIDGASLIQTYVSIFLPLSIPAFVVVLIWQFTASWNDFLFAVILTNSSNWPIMVALNNMAGSQIIAWNVQMAGSFLAALPTLIVYIILGRYFLRGLMSGALKG